ncbi:MAG: hypothetical protein RIQ52_1777 [Pseudomonadota bacterium]|jgi:sulfofructose kinase
MDEIPAATDVICIGHASYDMVYSLDALPDDGEKAQADGLIMCGGGPAANAAVAIARLGSRAAFCGYIGNDMPGRVQLQELARAGVNTDMVVRGDAATPVSCVWVTPDGQRTLVNYKGDTRALERSAFRPLYQRPRVLLADGHEPELALAALDWVRQEAGSHCGVVLDAGSLHAGTQSLMYRVDHLVASEKFARQFLGRDDPEAALAAWCTRVPVAVVTLGERGLVWRCGAESGRLPAFTVDAVVDTTGAGDAFHGAYAAGLAAAMPWQDLLAFASAAGSWCCTRMGARPGMPRRQDLARFMAGQPDSSG